VEAPERILIFSSFMKLKHILVGSVISLAAALPGFSGTVSWGSEAIERLFADSNGSYLPFGSLALLGTFDPSTDFATFGTDYSYLSGKFTEFGDARIGDGGFYDPLGDPAFWIYGGFGATTEVSALSTQLFYWVFNAPSAAGATEWGIYSNTADQWITPASLPESMQTDIAQGNFANFGSLTDELALTSFVRPAAVSDASSTSFLSAISLIFIAAMARRFKRT